MCCGHTTEIMVNIKTDLLIFLTQSFVVVFFYLFVLSRSVSFV